MCRYRPQLGKSRERGLNWTSESTHWSAGIKTVLQVVHQYAQKSCGPSELLLLYMQRLKWHYQKNAVGSLYKQQCHISHVCSHSNSNNHVQLSLKDAWNSRVFICRQNTMYDSAVLTDAGRAFQAHAASLVEADQTKVDLWAVKIWELNTDSRAGKTTVSRPDACVVDERRQSWQHQRRSRSWVSSTFLIWSSHTVGRPPRLMRCWKQQNEWQRQWTATHTQNNNWSLCMLLYVVCSCRQTIKYLLIYAFLTILLFCVVLLPLLGPDFRKSYDKLTQNLWKSLTYKKLRMSVWLSKNLTKILWKT